MYALNLFVICALVCCVFSETQYEEMGRRFCAKGCDNVEVLLCGEAQEPKIIYFFQTCASAKEKGLNTLEQLNNYYCDEAHEEDYFVAINCIVKNLFSMYTPDKIVKTSLECLAKSKC